MKPYALLCLLVILTGCEQSDIPIAVSPTCKCGCPDGPCYCTDCEKCGKKPEHKPAIAQPAVRRYEKQIWYTVYLNDHRFGPEAWRPIANVRDMDKCWRRDFEVGGWLVSEIDGGTLHIPAGMPFKVEKNERIRGKR